MKKIVGLLLALSFVFVGCNFDGQHNKDAVTSFARGWYGYKVHENKDVTGSNLIKGLGEYYELYIYYDGLNSIKCAGTPNVIPSGSFSYDEVRDEGTEWETVRHYVYAYNLPADKYLECEELEKKGIEYLLQVGHGDNNGIRYTELRDKCIEKGWKPGRKYSQSETDALDMKFEDVFEDLTYLPARKCSYPIWLYECYHDYDE